jgi:hypothetical protein
VIDVVWEVGTKLILNNNRCWELVSNHSRAACQRKNRANSWNDCHSRVEMSRQQAEKNLLGFRARASRISVWLQAGEDRAIAAGSRAD